MGHITISNLFKHYENRRRLCRPEDDPDIDFGDVINVLDDINLEVHPGEMVCILGPSGCGKSTLLKIVAGFEKPTSGRVEINATPVTGPGRDHIFVFQHNGLLPWMTVAENVQLGIRNLTDASEKQERVRDIVEMVELEGFENHYPHQLSGGMQRRAELARALIVNPDILFMDEPFSGLDFLTHMKMREEVVNMHEFMPRTTLMVTHDIDDALIMGDRIVVMGSRPSTITLESVLDFPRPRAFENGTELSKLRNDVFLMLGVPYAV
jgi:ABC-type nitrate/sulfonate/bicarbonate transport system ATPase subunit